MENMKNISVTWKTFKNILNKNANKDNFLPNQLNINGRLISNSLASSMTLKDTSAIKEKKWLIKPLL